MSKRVCILGMNLRHFETLSTANGGGERYTLELARLLRDLGYAVDLYQAVAAGRALDVEIDGFRLRGLSSDQRYGEWHYGIADAFTDAIDGQGYDHTLCLVPEYLSGRLPEGCIGVGHGVWWDDGRTLTDGWRDHLLDAMTTPAAVVSVDYNTVNVVRVLCGPAVASRITVIPNFVDAAVFSAASTPLTDTVPENPHVLIPRRACPQRGSRLFGAILAQLPSSCEVRWIGSTNDLESALMRRWCERYPNASFGVVPMAHMPTQYAWADIVLIPTTFSEGTSLACLEAMAAGRVTIATNVGGLCELIRDHQNGYLVPPTAEAIGGAVCEVLDNWGEATDMADQAVTDAYLRYNIALWRARWIDVLTQHWEDVHD